MHASACSIRSQCSGLECSINLTAPLSAQIGVVMSEVAYGLTSRSTAALLMQMGVLTESVAYALTNKYHRMPSVGTCFEVCVAGLRCRAAWGRSSATTAPRPTSYRAWTSSPSGETHPMSGQLKPCNLRPVLQKWGMKLTVPIPACGCRAGGIIRLPGVQAWQILEQLEGHLYHSEKLDEGAVT